MKLTSLSPLALFLALALAQTTSAGPTGRPDCEKLITAADIKAACGSEAKAPKKHFSENGKGINTCVRNVMMGGGDGIGILVRVAMENNATKAQGYFKHATGGDAMKGLGDEARYSERADGFGPHRTVALRKGTTVLEVKHHWMRKGKPACTKEQLTDLARTVLGRLK